jgi:tRNA(Ile)-lysidine synthase
MNWQEIARQIVDWGPSPMQDPALRSLLEEHQADTHWAVACSGGADSVYLLLWLWGHYFRHGQPNGIVLHYNHRVRGKDADMDQEWVGLLAESLGLRCFSACSERQDPQTAGEAAWRQERMDFFHTVLQAQHTKLLFTGHQAEDVAEWIMMRLARGTNAGGLSGPRPIQYWKSNGLTHVRPLLDMRRDELREQLRRAGANWREDSTNQETHYQRNQLRLRVLPLWEDASTAPLISGLLRSRKLLAEDDDALWQDLKQRTAGVNWKCSRIEWKASLSAALLRRAWLCWARCHPILLDRGSLLQDQVVESTLHPDKQMKLSLSHDTYLHVSASEWRLVCNAQTTLISWESPYPLYPNSSLHIPGNGILQCRWVNREERQQLLQNGFPEQGKFSLKAWLQGDSLQDGLWVRPVRQGDVMHPMGRRQECLVWDLLKKRGVPERERKQVFVVCTKDQSIVWTSGLPSAVHFKLEQIDKSALALEFIPYMGYL